jgi:putative transposase
VYEEIGRLKMELDWVKKVLPNSTAGSRTIIQPSHAEISISRQCELIALPRSSYYYEPKGESDYNLELMRIMDEQYLRTPFFGSRQMTRWLWNQGHPVNRKPIQRLMQIM